MSELSPPRPAPRRTYGRARAASPIDDSAPSLFVSSTTLTSNVSVSASTSTSIFPSRTAHATPTDVAGPEQSPSKSLLNRWTSNGSAWRKSLAGLDVPAAGTTPDDVEEDDAEELKREMERLRREARGLPNLGLPDPATVAAPGEQRKSTTIPTTMATATKGTGTGAQTLAPPPIRVSFSSDSLTDIPETSTPPPSSPPFAAKRPTHRVSSPDASGPQATSTEIDEETMPILKSGVSRATGRVRRILESDDEEEDEDENPFPAGTTRDKLSSPPVQSRSRPSRVAISSDAGTDTESASQSVSETEHSPSPSPRKRPAKPAETDGIDENTPRANHVQDFLATLADEDDAPEEDRAAAAAATAQMQKSSESIADPSGLFSDEEKGDPRAGKKVKGLKPLNKKEQKEMQKDMARARLERYVAPSRPEAERLPISSYLLNATKAISIKAPSRPSTVPAITAVPGLTFHGHSPATSTAHVTPVDEITAFTPSSNDAGKDRKDRSSKSRPSNDAPSSSPTPQLPAHRRRVTMVPGTSDGPSEEAEEAEHDLQPDNLEWVYDEDKVEKLAKRRRLEETKRALVQAQAARNKAKQPVMAGNNNESDSDLDFEVLPDPVKSVATTTTTTTTVSSKLPLPERRRGPDAKAVLRRDNTVSAISKQRQDQLRFAGRTARHKDEDASETFVEFAGRTFNHADLKRANGGAKPAERKAGRDRPVDAKSLDAMMKASHLRQVAAVQKKKEEDWGRARALPQRQEQDVEKLLDMTAKADARGVEDEEDEEDEEEDEDGDYDPEDEDSGDEVVQFSGDEDEDEGEGDGEEAGSDVENDLEMSEGDKENVPLSSSSKQYGEDEDEDDEPLPLKVVRKARASNRAVVDSDDEEVTPRRPTEPRQPLGEVSAPAQADVTPKGIEPTFVDLAGFGSGGIGGSGSGSGSGSPGFSQLFEATQAVGLTSGAVDAFAGLRAAPQAGLFPAHALLPGVQISETQAERDNALVAGEADMEVDSDPLAFQPKAQYLNSQGLFTQTRPRAIPMPTPTHLHTHTQTEESQTQGRPGPLAGRSDWSILGGEGEPNRSSSPTKETLETTEKTLSSPGKYSLPPPPAFSPTQGSQQFTRLKRRSSTDRTDSITEDANESSESPSQPKQTDAFSALMAASHRRQRMEERAKSRPKRSALVDEQAEESDEDNGWLRADAGEDENDDEEDDGRDLQDLVDDQAVNEEEKKRQDALAEEKRREIEKADDEKREAEARDVIEGKHRIKRKGQDFFSEDEDEENQSGRKKWPKKMLKKRKLEREDGLHKLDGEVNVFVDAYEQDMESDGDDIEEVAGFSDREREDSPPAYSARDAYTLVRAAAKRNRGKNLDEEETQLDAEIANGVGEDEYESFRTTTSRSRDLEVDMEGDDEMAEMSQFSISRSTRVFAAVSASNGLRKTTSIRSEDNFQAYLQAESLTNRRVGPIGGVSVVSATTNNNNNNLSNRSSNGSGSSGFASSRPSIKPLANGNGAKHPQPSRQSSTSSSASSILRSKTGKFA